MGKSTRPKLNYWKRAASFYEPEHPKKAEPMLNETKQERTLRLFRENRDFQRAKRDRDVQLEMQEILDPTNTDKDLEEPKRLVYFQRAYAGLEAAKKFRDAKKIRERYEKILDMEYEKGEKKLLANMLKTEKKNYTQKLVQLKNYTELNVEEEVFANMSKPEKKNYTQKLAQLPNMSKTEK